jgi:hypothetical protein
LIRPKVEVQPGQARSDFDLEGDEVSVVGLRAYLATEILCRDIRYRKDQREMRIDELEVPGIVPFAVHLNPLEVCRRDPRIGDDDPRHLDPDS